MDDLPPDGAPHALRWDAESLWEQLEALLPGLSIEVLAQAESTNTVLIERARKLAGRLDAPVSTPGELDRTTRIREHEQDRSNDRGPAPGLGPYGRRAVDTHPGLLVAEHQTLGRGRMGRDWLSRPGRSLTMSLGLPMQPHQWGGLSLAVGVALAEALDPLTGPNDRPKIGLKWPNDLWLIDSAAPNGVGRKLGGILIETVPVGRLRMVVVGVGLNVLPLADVEAEPPSSRQFGSGFACLSEIDAEASAPATLHRLALPLVRALQRFEVTGLEPMLSSFARRDVLAGKRVSVLRAPAVAGAAPAPVEVTAVGVSAQGALLVRDSGASGTAESPVTEITSGEVSVRVNVHQSGGSGRWLAD